MYSRRIVIDRMRKKNVVADGPRKKTQERRPKRIHHTRILGRNVSMTAGSTPKSVYFGRERNPTVAAIRSNKTPQKRQTVGVSTEIMAMKTAASILSKILRWGIARTANQIKCRQSGGRLPALALSIFSHCLAHGNQFLHHMVQRLPMVD